MNTIRLLSYASIALLTCTNVLASSDNVYKWKDKNGVVHYSQNAPQGQTAEIISTKTPRTSLPTEIPADTDDTASPAKETDDSAIPLATKDQGACDKATQASQELQKPIIMNEEGKIMTIDQKNDEIRRMQEVINIHC